MAETEAIRNAKAAFWDAGMGEGNTFQRLLIGPASERLLGSVEGQRVIDVACGNGVFARRMAALGGTVVATDFSQTFLDLAAARVSPESGLITYLRIDATEKPNSVPSARGRSTLSSATWP